MATDETPITFPDAARTLKLGVGWRRLRDWCRAAGVAIDYGGGTEGGKRYRVLPSDARRVVLDRRVPPPGKPARVRRVPAFTGPLHPLVKC